MTKYPLQMTVAVTPASIDYYAKISANSHR